MTMRKIILSFVLVSLITFSLIGFAVDMSSNNNINNSILDNPQMEQVYGDLEDDLNELEQKGIEQKENFESDSIRANLGFFILDTIISGTRVFTNIIIGFFNILGAPLTSIIGLPSAILGAFTFLLLLSLIFYAYKLFKQGE